MEEPKALQIFLYLLDSSQVKV